MKRSRPHLGAGLLTAIALAATIASGVAAQDEKPTIRVAYAWASDNGIDTAFQKALTDWGEAHKDEVNLVMEGTAGDAHRTKLSTDLAADNSADIMSNWTGAEMVPFVEKGLLLPMDDYLALSKTVTKDQWDPAQLRNSTFDDVLYGLPIEAFKCFTLYNTTLFDKYGVKPPVTQQDLYDVAAVFTANDIVPLDVGSKGGNPGHLVYNEYLYELPGGIEDVAAVGQTYDVSQAPFSQAAGIIHEMVEKGVFPKDVVANGDWPPSVNLYNQGKAAMVYTCPWMLESIDPAIAAVSETMKFPTIEGAAHQGGDFSLGNAVHGIQVNKASFEDPAKQALMVSLLDSIFSDSTIDGMVSGGMIPALHVDLSKVEISPLAEKVLAFTDSIPDTHPVLAGLLPNTATLSRYLEVIDRIWAGEDPNSAWNDLVQVVADEKP